MTNTWRSRETDSTDNNPPAGYNLFQYAYIDANGLIASFTDPLSGDKIFKYIKDDETEIRYIQEYVLGTELVGHDMTYLGRIKEGTDSNYFTEHDLPGIADFVSANIGYAQGYWFAGSTTKIYRSSDRVTWTLVHTTSSSSGIQDVVAGASGEVLIVLAGTTTMLASNDSGATFTELTFPKSSGSYGCFYVDGKFWHFFEQSEDSYTNYWCGKQASISSATMETSARYNNAIVGAKPSSVKLYKADDGKWLMLTNNIGSKFVVSYIDTSPSGNDWAGIELTADSTHMIGDTNVQFAGTSTTNWFISSKGYGYPGATENMIHSSGNTLQVPTVTSWYDRSAGKWYAIADNFDTNYVVYETTDLSSTTTVGVTGLDIYEFTQVFWR